MLENIHSRNDLLGFSRIQKRAYYTQTVQQTAVEQAIRNGWIVERENKSSTRMRREKPKADLLESRVWMILWNMGFKFLSGKGGAQLVVNPKDPKSPRTQVDATAIDDDVALDIECKSSKTPQKDAAFSEKLAKLGERRGKFAQAVNRQFSGSRKRQVASVMFTWDIILRECDRKRAEASKIILYDLQDLEYFEALVKHLGPAARYQLLAELFRGKVIPGLEIKVPALKARMGSYTCYSFAVKPEYLLKIAYVAHRAKGKALDVDAYQRLVSKTRLKRIAEYISGEDGIFPTNIVVNIEKTRHVQFDRGKQDGDSTGGVFGWLSLRPSYGSAWIIDGQHRLFAYSGHPRAKTSYIHVLAFEGLQPPKQAQLFVSINSEQKRVKRSLLVELDATLKWDDEDDSKRIDAITSKVGMALDEDPESPLHGRILPADVVRTDVRCVSLTSLTSALNQPGFFIVQKRKDVTVYGPFWRDSSTATLRRAVVVVRSWLRTVADQAADWWELGADKEGGGLAMNNGVTVCLNVLRSVLKHVGESVGLQAVSDDELVNLLHPYGINLGTYLNKMSMEARREFRSLQGVAGQTHGTRICEEGLRSEFGEFNPLGLDEWIERKNADTNQKARGIIDWIEKTLQDVVLNGLKSEYGLENEAWWYEGVPQTIRKKVTLRIEESNGKTGSKEQNFDLIHYRDIIKGNWQMFGHLFGRGKGNKDKKTEWLYNLARLRNAVSHPSRRKYLSLGELATLEDTKSWIESQISAETKV